MDRSEHARRSKVDLNMRTCGFLLAGFLLPLCAAITDAHSRPPAEPQGFSKKHQLPIIRVVDDLSSGETSEDLEQEGRFPKIREILERTKEAWKDVQQVNQEVWERARQKTREVWRKARQDPQALGREAIQEIQQIWSDAQREIREVHTKALQEIQELWKKVQEKAQDYEKRKISQDREQDAERGEAVSEAMVFVVPGTDVRLPFKDIGADPDWLKDNIEGIVQDSKSKHTVANFTYKQPWLPGLCTNRKGKCYQANVDNLAEVILKQFEKCCRDGKTAFKVVAHSYGAAITYGALKKLDQDSKAKNIRFRVDRLVTLSPAPLILYHVVPSNVAVWKNIHGGFGYVDGIGDENNIQIDIAPEPGKLQAIMKERRFSLNTDHSAIVNDKRGRKVISKALDP